MGGREGEGEKVKRHTCTCTLDSYRTLGKEE